MPERITIASLAIDEKGAVQSFNQTIGATQKLETQTKQTSDVFVTRMFNMRTAAMAFLGSFTIAGAIYGLKNLVEEAARAQPTFKQATDAWADFKDQMIQTVAVALNLNAALPYTKGFLNDVSEAFRLLLLDDDQIKRLERQFAAVMPPGYTWAAPGKEGKPSTPPSGEQLAAANYMGGLLAGADASKIFAQNQKVATRVDEMNIALQEFSETWSELVLPVEEVGLGFESAAESMGKITESDLGGLTNQVLTLDDYIYDLSLSLTTAQLKFTLIMQAAQDFAQQFTAAITEGGFSFKKFMGEMLISIGQTLLAWGALGIVTSYFGYAPGYKAAGIALAAGTAAIALGHSMSGGHEGAAAGGGSYGRAAAGGGLGGAAPSYQISFNIEGNVIGNEDWARQNAIWIKKALADGAAGGSF